MENPPVDLDGSVSVVQCSDDAEKLIVKIARVSNPKNQSNWATGPKLLKFLIDNSHWSPFEHAYLTVKIFTQVDIAAQICRHRSAVFSQFSQRYAKSTSATMPKFRAKHPTNRQASLDNLHPEIIASAEETTQALFDQAFSLYERLLEKGVAKECARRILPQATNTNLYMTNNLRNWMMYVNVRTDPSTQLEHRLIAEEIKKILIWKFPITSEAMGWIE